MTGFRWLPYTKSIVHFYWLPPLLAGILDLFLCLLVLRQAPRRSLNRAFAFFTLSLVSWNLDIAALYFFPDADSALLWSSVFRYGMLFIPPTLYHMILEFTGRWSLANRLLLAVGYWTSFLLCLGNGAGLLVDRVEKFVWGYYPIGTPLYKLHTLADLLYFAATVYQLVRCLRVSDSARQRQQLKIVLLGFVVLLSAGLTNLLPVYGVSIYPLGNLGNVFFVGALTYAIVRHRLLDVDLIITKTVASVLALILWLIPLWMLTAEVQRQIYGVADGRLLSFAFVVFVLSALVFPWLLHASEKVVRRLLWGQKFDSLQALSAFQRTMIQVLDQKKILTDLRDVLGDALQTEFVTVYLCQPTANRYADPLGEAPSLTLKEDFSSAFMRRQGPIVREEILLEEDNAEAFMLASVMTERKAEICVPLSAQERLLGFLLLGRKRNREVFSVEDLRVLTTLGAEAAVALENARLYEELRSSQVMLARTDRLAAVGTLAAGIAHEIRNPLVAVQTFIQLLPEQIDDPEFRTTFLDLTNSELSRVSTLINDLMTFARPSPATLDEAQVNDVAEQIVRLLTGQAKKRDVTLIANLAPDIPPFVVDQGQIKQVFMNLVMNAMQATPAGGTVTITTSLTHETDGQGWCVITVQDTGSGIPLDQKEQIFDPFFTTKESGVGLGLFITHQIIEEHGGTIKVESEVGKGAQFLIHLPIKRLFSDTEISVSSSSFQTEGMDTLAL